MSFAISVLKCGTFGDPTSNSYIKWWNKKGCVSLTRCLAQSFIWLDISTRKIVAAFSAVQGQKGNTTISPLENVIGTFGKMIIKSIIQECQGIAACA